MTMNRGSKFVTSMLAATLAVTAMPVTAFADTSSDKDYSILNAFEVDSPSYLDELLQNQNGEGTPIYGENDMVTVIVELDDASVMDFYDVETYGLEDDKTVGEAVSEFLASEEVQEISDEIGIPKEDIVYALDAIQSPMSLQEPVYNDSGDALYVMDQVSDKKNKEETWVEHLALQAAMNLLSERERYIIRLRFFEGKTQMEVAEEINISQAEVSRLEKTALKSMRKYLS